MSPRRFLPFALVATLTFAGCGGSSPAAPTQTTTTTTPPTTTVVASTWTLEGTRLIAANFGITGQGSGQAMADSTTIRLTDGRWRMYIFAGTAYTSAISNDGLAFTPEGGFRLPAGSGQSRAIRLSDGRIRIYFSSGQGINSAVSSDDGANFTVESGLRISAASAGMSGLTGPGIVKLLDGRYRAYFSDLPIPGQGPIPHSTKSAISTDLLTWTVEAGFRVGPGATLSGNTEHPCAIINPDGSTTIFYFRNSDAGLYSSTSTDGLTFSTETNTGIPKANDPDIVSLPDGTVRLYYNWLDATATPASTLSSAKRATAAVTFGFNR